MQPETDDKIISFCLFWHLIAALVKLFIDFVVSIANENPCVKAPWSEARVNLFPAVLIYIQLIL